MNWLDKIPLAILAPIAILLALAPFTPEPHLWEKLKMLFSGTLTQRVDKFDLFVHAAPLFLLGLKLARMLSRKPPPKPGPGPSR
ncbi:MAG: RND transporter [Gammaproteobacteria bacterium]|jgi:hypothetical protein|nr:RND transporter [Gammaproteobacteria bacterium]